MDGQARGGRSAVIGFAKRPVFLWRVKQEGI